MRKDEDKERNEFIDYMEKNFLSEYETWRLEAERYKEAAAKWAEEGDRETWEIAHTRMVKAYEEWTDVCKKAKADGFKD